LNRKYLPFVGLDDFAFHKDHTYGTLICDLQSKTPLALLPDRLSETVTTWLKKHPLIKVVSRDGFTAYRQGITDASKTITQIYDRWHFIKNAKNQLDSFLSTLVPATVTWSEPQVTSIEIPFTRTEQTGNNRRNKKWELIQEIQQAHKKGENLSRLAREYKLDRRTITKYIKMVEPPVFHRHRKRPSDLFKDQIIQLEKEGNTTKGIYSSIRDLGYTGTFSGIRKIVEIVRKERKYGLSKEDTFHISRKKLCALMWKPKDELVEDEKNSLEKWFELYQSIKTLYNTVQTYRKAIQMGDIDTFVKWLREQLSSKKNPFYYYALRLRSDFQAVKNALFMPYSNGLLEGQINRLKTIKRITYGRAGLVILEKRVL
jgi:transposase